MNKAIPIILAILISAAVFGGGGYLLGAQQANKDAAKKAASATITATTSTQVSGTSTADVTADWKTYTNETYGFSFKYPSDWEVRDQTSANKGRDATLQLIAGANPQNNREDMLFIVKVNSGTLSDLVNKFKTALTSNSSVVSDTTVTKYGKQLEALVLKNNSSNLQYTTYFVQIGENVMQITGNKGNKETVDDYTKIANQIVETFQFTK